MNIITIRVSVADGIRKNEEYAPPRKAEVDLTASIEEGANADVALNVLAHMANIKVAEIIANKLAPLTKTEGAASAPAKAPSSAVSADAASSAPKNDKERLAEEAGLTAKPAAVPAKKRPPKAEKPVAAVAEDPLADDSDPLAEEKDEMDDLLGGSDEEAPPPPVSDATLAKAVQVKNGTLNNPGKLRELAAKFGGGPMPKQLRDIPADKRWSFLRALEELS